MAKKSTSTKNSCNDEASSPVTAHEKRSFLKARSVLRPTMQASATVKEYSRDFGDVELDSLLLSLTEQTSASSKGNLQRAEAMFTAQAHTLDAIFNYLARCAVNADYIDNLDQYLKLALRAQSQCRTTWEALVTIKNPPLMGYVRQANIAHGPQQVNNEAAPNGDNRFPHEKQNLQNKLLEKQGGKRLDPGTAGAAGKVDPEMETVGKIHGTEN